MNSNKKLPNFPTIIISIRQQGFQRTQKKKKKNYHHKQIVQEKGRDPDNEAIIIETVPIHKPAKGYNTITHDMIDVPRAGLAQTH